jgi:hypothetical protein
MYELDHSAAQESGELAMRCPECRVVGNAVPGEQVYACPSCQKVWELASCPSCGEYLLMELGCDPREQFICPWCADTCSLGPGQRPTAEEVAERVRQRGAAYFDGDVLVRGLIVVGVIGMPIAVGTRITLAVSSDSLIFGTVPWNGLTFRVLYDDLVTCEVTDDTAVASPRKSDATAEPDTPVPTAPSDPEARQPSANGSFDTVVDRGVVETLRRTSPVNTFVRLSTPATDLYAHHSTLTPERLRPFLAPAANAIAARRNGVSVEDQVTSRPPVERAETLMLLTRLRQSGTLSDDEFHRATQRVLQQTPTR